MRALVALALLVVAVTAAGAATASEAEEDPPAPVGAASPVTPVLSPRRVPGLLAAPVADRRLVASLDAVLARQPGAVCFTVTSGGRTIMAVDDEQELIPASLEKLLTAAVALEVLGPDHRFRTRVVAESPAEGGAVAGDAWLVGSGDPLLATAAYTARFENQPQVRTPLEELADALVRAGVQRIDGRLVGDESRYDTDRFPDAWPARFAAQDVSGPLSALSVNDGWATFPPAPDVRAPDESPAPDPALHGAGVLAIALAERGVGVADGVASGAAPGSVVELASVESPPLTEIVGEMLRESDNQTAELLLKEIALAAGRTPTTVDGAAVVAEVAARLGLPVEGSVVADGSGLSEADRHSCDLFQAVLDQSGPQSAIGAGLPVAGETGTLTRRFLDSPVTGRLRAKTGTLNRVTALAGFLETTPGAQLSFTFIANLDQADVVDGPDLVLQDELVAALARYPEGPSLAELGPRPVAGVETGAGG